MRLDALSAIGICAYIGKNLSITRKLVFPDQKKFKSEITHQHGIQPASKQSQATIPLT